MKSPHLAGLLRVLAAHGVELVLVGRTAARLHLAQSNRLDRIDDEPFADICFRQVWANCECLNRAVEELGGHALPTSRVPTPLTGLLRGAGRPLRVRWPDGTLNLFPRVLGLGDYEELRVDATGLRVEECFVRCLSEPQLHTWIEAACVATGTPMPSHEDALREASRRRAMRWLELEDEPDPTPLEH